MSASAAQTAPATSTVQIATAPFIPALTPGSCTQQPIDYSKAEGQKYYKSATKGIEPKFNGKPEHLRTFLATVERKIEEYAWRSITTIPDSVGVNHFLVNSYGLVSMANVRAHAEVYTTAPTISRDMQDSHLLYEFLMNSLDNDFTSRIINLNESYKIGDRKSGPLLLKLIIDQVQVATTGKATPYYLETALFGLPEKIREFESIVDFNTYVRSLLQQLANYGQKAERIIHLLFQAYLQVEDEEFNVYVKHLLMAYDHGHSNAIKNGESLMASVEEQYKLQILRKTWKVPNKLQTQIIALKAQLESFQKKGKENNPKKGNQDAKDPKDAKDDGKKKADAWKKKPPKDINDPKQLKKERKGRTFHWCPAHEMWTAHKSEDCRLQKDSNTKNTPTANVDKKEDKKGPKKTLKARLAQLVTDSCSEDEE
jgi:hypothetical protein